MHDVRRVKNLEAQPCSQGAKGMGSPASGYGLKNPRGTTMRLAYLWTTALTVIGSGLLVGCQTPLSLTSRDETKANDPHRLIQIARTFEAQGHTRNAMAIYGQLANGSPYSEEAERRYLALGGSLNRTATGTQLASAKAESSKSAKPDLNPPAKLAASKEATVATHAISTKEKQPDESDSSSTQGSVDVPEFVAVPSPEESQLSEGNDSEWAADLVKLDAAIDSSPSNAPKTVDAPASEVTITKTTTTTSEKVVVTESTTDEAVVHAEVDWTSASAEVSPETDVEVAALVENPAATGFELPFEDAEGAFTPPPLPEDVDASLDSLDQEVLVTVEKLSSVDSVERTTACFQLAALGNQASSASSALEQCLTSEDHVFRCHAAWALHEINGNWDQVVETLVGVLRNGNDSAVELAAYYLSYIQPKPESAMADLRAHFTSENMLVKLHCSEAALRIQPSDKEALDVILDCLSHEDLNVRWLASQAVNGLKCDPIQIVEALDASLEHPDTRIQAAAALSIGGFGENAEASISKLEKLCLSSDADVKEAAKASLACLKKEKLN